MDLYKYILLNDWNFKFTLFNFAILLGGTESKNNFRTETGLTINFSKLTIFDHHMYLRGFIHLTVFFIRRAMLVDKPIYFSYRRRHSENGENPCFLIKPD